MSIADRAYRTVLHLYPRSFRERFGDEMLELFQVRRRAAADRGLADSVLFWTSTAVDATKSALYERLPDASVMRRVFSFRDSSVNIRDALRLLRQSPATSLTIVLLMALT